ncbi:poly [ADP-ribose] polymerase tankyrase-like [Haliotis cracherodii]|uniref:poly [ADP-ribose] polymerase tankyrase-like n=1 Tax=Haliotis cracherodii TaxID=6455 RepID=UPI0039ECFC7B
MEKGDKSKTKEEASSSGGSGHGVKRKKIYNVEPRTPLKRQRIPVARFQSPVLEEGAVKPKPPKEEIVILYKKGIFLAVRGAENSVYLCKTQQNVHSTTRQFRIQWLNLDQPPNIYKMDYIDHTDIECVLTNVRMERIARDTLRLPHSEQERAEKILQRAVKAERGEPFEEEEDIVAAEEEIKEEEDSEEEEEEEEDWDEEPSPRKSVKGKAKTPKQSRAGIKVALTKGKKRQSQRKDKDKKKGKGKEKRKKEEKKKEAKKKGPDGKLKPNPKIKVLEKALFFETKEKIPFISVPVKSRQVIRAVLTKDIDLLKSLIASESDVYRLDVTRSIGCEKTAVDYAIQKGNKDILELLISDIFNPENKRHKQESPSCLLKESDVGRYNPVSLGVGNIRALNVSRGAREGNDAFLKDMTSDEMSMDYVIECLLKYDADPALIDLVLAADQEEGMGEEHMNTLQENIYRAITLGNRKIAAKLVADAEKRGGLGFNYLHSEVLNFEKEDLRSNILSASVRKKPYGNEGITPLHCAAINPNVKYLSRLLQIEPDISLFDKRNRRPIHFAAVCQGTGPLDLLLERGATINEADTEGNTALHCACRAGRASNVDVLLKRAKNDASVMNDAGMIKWGIGGVNRPNRNSFCPIHMAILNGHSDVVKVLIKHGADLNKQVSAGKEKKSPLMMAAETGNLDVARLLVQNGATVELLDKFKRSALTHAVINGNSHVASYLLYLGADPNRADSSGNTLVHYAAAYGWYFCLRMLINDAGADTAVPNSWNCTPLAIAFLKNNMGMVELLLNQPGMDINFKDESGMTLTSIAVRSKITSALVRQVEYLVNDKKADPTITDLEGRNALHHLAANSIKVSQNYYRDEVSDSSMEITVKIAESLIKAGCDPSQATNDGWTPITLAIEQLNSKLVHLLVEKGGSVSPEKNPNTHQNVLHMMAAQCMSTDLAPLVEILADQKARSARKPKKVDAPISQKKDEAMEVDEQTRNSDGKSAEVNDEKTAELNGEKVEKKPAEQVEKVNGEIEDEPMQEETVEENILKKMAVAVDQDGMTPLLRACHTYKEYENDGYWSLAQLEKIYQQGRDFIRTMVDMAGSDINKTVERMHFDGKMPVKERDQYCEEGKSSPLHMMVRVSGEPVVDRGGVKVQFPGLELILKYKPKLEVKNIEDQTPLAAAVEAGKSDVVSLLLKHGADANTSSSSEEDGPVSPLLCVAMSYSLSRVTGQEKLLKLLVDAKANVHITHKKSQKTPLHFVVQQRVSEAGMMSMAQALVSAGANVNAVDNHKRTVFHLAINSNNGSSDTSTDLEEYLLEKGADVFAKDIRERLPLHYAFVKIGRHTNGSSVDPIELCSLLTSKMGTRGIDDADAFGQTPLHCASVRGATICCMHLMQRKAEIGKKDHTGNTPLSLAVKHQHESCAIMLIQRCDSVRDSIVVPPPEEIAKTDNDKKKQRSVMTWRPLTQWVKVVKPEKVVYPVFQGALRSELQGVAHLILDINGIDFSAVEAAFTEAKYNVALRLIKRIPEPSRLQAINEEGRNLFHMLILKTKGSSNLDAQLKVAKMLRDKGVPVGLRDKHGCTPLQYAAIHHLPVQMGQFLIDNDPALDVKNKDGFGRDVMSAYMWNICDVNTKWLKLLVDKGATFDVRFDRPLPDSLLLGSCLSNRCPDYFTDKGDLLVSPLILAIHYFKFGLVSFMLNNGASPNFDDSTRRTPLMHAARQNDGAIVKLLMNFSYDPNAQPVADSFNIEPSLFRSASRTVFMLRPDGSMSLTPEVVGQLGNGSESKSPDGSECGSSVKQMDLDDKEIEAEEDEEPEVIFDEEEEVAEDSDHDTDVVEEEDEEETPAKISVLSKQLSLRKQGSSLARKVKMVEKTSSVDLDATDNQGWTVIHHLVSPLELGTFDQVELLCTLAHTGAILDKKDNAGLSPLDYALIRGAPNIAAQLQKLLKSEKEEKATFTSFEVSDGILTDVVKVDFQADYAKVMDKLTAEAMDEDDSRTPVDSHCLNRDTSEVAEDTKQHIPYDVLLSKVDVSYGSYGMYNFYKMQLVYQKGKDIYMLFTRWGRIGDEGQFQHTPFRKKEDGVKEFCKIFRSKTGNDWNNVKTYVNHPKKYRLVPREQKYTKVKSVDFSLNSEIPSKLPLPIQDLIKEMSNQTMLQRSVSKAGLDTEYMPFGRIQREALLEARSILTELSELIQTIEKQRRNTATNDMAAFQDNCDKIASLTNDYYNLVPSPGFEYEAIKPINKKKRLKMCLRFLSDMLDIEIASRIVLGSQQHLKDMNPLDYIYRSVGCQIEPLSPDSLESQYILTYVNASHQSSKVHSIYKLSRPGEEEQLRALNMSNHSLLWHGSSMSNFISILNRGLLIAPPEAPHTGHLFGEGIYFADAFAKSHSYSYNYNPESDVNLMLLCQVALGTSKVDVDQDDDDHLDTAVNSIKIRGQQEPAPEYDVAMPFGTNMPLGRTTYVESYPRPYMPYNEYIVHDASQVCLRYMIMFSD